MTLYEKLEKYLESHFESWFDVTKGQVSDSDLHCHFGLDSESLENELEDRLVEINCVDEDREIYSKKIRDEIIKEKAEEWLSDRISNFLDDLESNLEFIDSNHVQIYRSIQIKEEDYDIFIKNLAENKFLYDCKGIGPYWSFLENATECHWAMNFNGARVMDVNLVAIIRVDDIDVELTGGLNVDLSCGEDEKEIRLKEDAYVNVIKINDKNVDLLVKV